MLTITRSHNAQSATDYFTEGLSVEGYYMEDNTQAVWKGKAAKRLGLYNKTVNKTDFKCLVSNMHPKTKKRLTVRNVENRRAGFDLTFSAVKSVSILYALTGDQDILKAHRDAYTKAMMAVEADAQTQANTKGKRIYQGTGNLIYSAFDHFTSRPNEITRDGKTTFISDPQLHTHCYIPNVTWNEEKKRFQAIEMGNLHRLANYYESLYHSYLSNGLKELGYGIERNDTRYEIAGVSRGIIERFSNRTKTIEQVAKEKGITDAKAKAKLGATTRHSKAKTLSHDALLKSWKRRLSGDELNHIQNLKHKPYKQDHLIASKEAIDMAISHFEARQSAYQKKRVLAHALTLGYGHLLPKDVITELDRRENILEASIDSVTYMTTKEMVKAEDRMIRLAALGKGMSSPIHPSYKIKQEFLNDQQREAIQTLLQSYDRINVLKGSAGVGKTSLLTEINTASKELGKKLIALAPSSQAVKVLAKKGFEADTIAGFLINTKKHEHLRYSTLLVDEAGMVGVKTMSKLLELSKTYDAKMILSGDTRQHNSVEFGDALRILEDKAGLKTAQVSKIVRQKPSAYKQAVEHLAKGDVIKGYEALEKTEAIKEIPDHEKRIDQIANDYIESIKQKRSALIISPTHTEGDRINEVVRQKLKKEGLIKGKEWEYETLKDLSFTDSQKQDQKRFKQGQVLRFINHQKGGYKAGGHYQVLPPAPGKPIQIKHTDSGQILPLPLENHQNYQVYDKVKTKLAGGDSIRLTANTKSIEQTKMNNGTVYKVEGFTKSGDLKLSNNKTLSKDNGHYKPAYSETSYSSQGKDAKDVFISMSDLSFGGVSKEQFYVSVSRGTHSAKIYTSDKTELKKAILRSNERLTAKEIASSSYNHNMELHRHKQIEHYKTLNTSKTHQKDQGKHPRSFDHNTYK